MIHFSLYAVDDEALRIINDPRNASLKQPGPNGRPCFVIGDDHTSKSCGNLLSIGRNEETSDVYLGSSRYYSGTQCYIYVHPLSGEYVLRDKSGSKSTVLEVEGDHDKKYTLQGDPRRRVLPRGRSARICCRKATFHIWWPDAALPSEQLRVPQVNEVVERSTVERQSALPPPRETRVQPPKLPDGVQQLEKIDHEVRRNLGSGAFGQVKLTVDLDSGRLLAVKRISVPPENEKRAKQAAKTEVHLLAKLAHVSTLVVTKSCGY